MPPKRKADDTHDEVEQDIVDGPSGEHVASTSTAKRARVSEPVAEASSSNRTVDAKTMGWQDIVLVGEDEVLNLVCAVHNDISPICEHRVTSPYSKHRFL